MCKVLLDRKCWLFAMQALISTMAIILCSILIYTRNEIEWAKSILIMIVSVWFPSPSVGLGSTIIQNEDHNEAISATGATGRRWSELSPVQRKKPWSPTGGEGDVKELANEEESKIPTQS